MTIIIDDLKAKTFIERVWLVFFDHLMHGAGTFFRRTTNKLKARRMHGRTHRALSQLDAHLLRDAGQARLGNIFVDFRPLDER